MSGGVIMGGDGAGSTVPHPSASPSIADIVNAAFGHTPEPAALTWYLSEMFRTKAILNVARRMHPELSDVPLNAFELITSNCEWNG